jgi:hypothetical protein
VTDEANVAGASGDDATPLTVEAAAERLTALEVSQTESETPTTPDAEPRAGEASDDARTDPPAGEDGEGEDDQGEGEAIDFDNIHGNTKLRLRDGSFVTVGELKKNFAELREIPKRSEELSAQAKQFEARQAKIAEQERVFNSVLPQAMAVLQANIPPLPTPDTWEMDPIAAIQQERAHNEAVGRLRMMQSAAVQRQQQIQQETAAEREARLMQAHETLMREMPQLKDEKVRTTFLQDMMSVAKAAGFNEKEVNAIDDPRIFKILEKSIKYDKLMAQKPKPDAPVKQAIPPQAPGRRVTTGERKNSDIESRMSALRSNGGSIDDALAILNAMEK